LRLSFGRLTFVVFETFFWAFDFCLALWRAKILEDGLESCKLKKTKGLDRNRIQETKGETKMS